MAGAGRGRRTAACALVLIGPLLLIGALTACHRQPSFDERYASAAAAIRAKADALDADLATRDAADRDDEGAAAATSRAGAPNPRPSARTSSVSR